MLDRVFTTVRRHDLLPRGCHVLVAVSGGADSVALAHALHYLQRRHPFAMTIAHLHHGIRGRAADEDRDFVRLLAWKLGAPCVDEEADVPGLSRRLRVSLEMAGRDARRAFFLRAAARVGADRVATAHTADDDVETFFLRLLRGAGAQGLGGLPPRVSWRGLALVRPLIDVTKLDVQEFLRAHGVPWREDETNRDLLILRNRVRHELLPYLERSFQPSLRAITRRTAALLRDEHAWLDEQATLLLARLAVRGHPDRLQAEGLLAQPAAARRRVLIRWLVESGFQAERIDYETMDRLDRWAIGTLRGARLSLPGGWSVARRPAFLEVAGPRAPSLAFAAALSVPGEVVLEEAGVRVRAEAWRGIIRPPRARAGQVPAEATIRADRLGRGRLQVRSWRAGDRMEPLGFAGSVKLQDLFVDQKVPREARGRIPVVVHGRELVWLPGYRVARAWAVPDEAAASVRLTVDAWP